MFSEEVRYPALSSAVLPVYEVFVNVIITSDSCLWYNDKFAEIQGQDYSVKKTKNKKFNASNVIPAVRCSSSEESSLRAGKKMKNSKSLNRIITSK